MQYLVARSIDSGRASRLYGTAWLRYGKIVCATSLSAKKAQCRAGLSIFVEPCNVIYSVPYMHIDKALDELEEVLPTALQDTNLVQRSIANREGRTASQDASLLELVALRPLRCMAILMQSCRPGWSRPSPTHPRRTGAIPS